MYVNVDRTFSSCAALNLNENTIVPNQHLTMKADQTVCGYQDDKLIIFGGTDSPNTLQVVTLDKKQGITLSRCINVIEKRQLYQV